ncbi:hypothetical protein K4L44_16950 [Halosquirtibacter laminarini]|uniref:Uncharacterized protein n=1 Tax=Halosquirtibacter laminarini TaxID=3374600 RepID=A0AC61NF27_9BACT|nr:hypothetical protein K4L44_16950 [Prolixibacteraceae bacterium]
MNQKALILYHTNYGFSYTVAEFVKQAISRSNLEVVICSIDQADLLDLFSYSYKYIISPIKYGNYAKKVLNFLKQYDHILSKTHCVIVSIDLVSRKNDRNSLENNKQVSKIWSKLNWTPTRLIIIPGELDYSKYNFIEKKMMKLLMYIMKGPTDSNTSEVYTNWKSLESQIKNDLH